LASRTGFEFQISFDIHKFDHGIRSAWTNLLGIFSYGLPNHGLPETGKRAIKRLAFSKLFRRNMSQRNVIHRYEDPVDLVWLRAAADLGLTVVRSADVFAAYDGNGTLTICDASHFDADDCLAQMIFHEICHWLVAGRRGYKQEDWGLSNVDDRDLVFEYAAIRVQAALATPFGLRDFMAVTTDWRPYWDALTEDPLAGGDDPAIKLAQNAAHLARLSPFKEVIDRALSATAAIADVVRDFADSTSLWSASRPRHRLGSLLSKRSDLKCGSCAWLVSIPATDTQSPKFGCRQHAESCEELPFVESQEPACEKWEPVFTIDDCGSCGACCRQGFDLLTVANDDPFKRLLPELVQLRDDGEHCVPRPDGVCVALDGDGSEPNPYRCRHYDVRPKNCSEFEVAGEACLLARRRVGLSR
jgi:hypothetical protein